MEVNNQALLEATYGLDVLEQKFLRILSTKMKSSDPFNSTYELNTSSILQELDLSGLRGSGYLKRITANLRGNVFEIRNASNNTMIQTSWLTKVMYYQKEPVLSVEIDESLKEFFLYLKEDSNTEDFNEMYRLKRHFSKKMYSFIKNKMGTNMIRILNLDELRNELEAKETSYLKYADFKRRVLDAAIEEINEKTNLNVCYDIITTGRKVTAVRLVTEVKTN